MNLISLAKSGSRGTRADQGGRPPNWGKYVALGYQPAPLPKQNLPFLFRNALL